jgi:hypothetical protein
VGHSAPPTLRCQYCEGDLFAPDHDLRCDGRQGVIEAVIASTTITRPRETSVQAFYNAVDAGVIETRRQQVWAALRALGEATSNEVFQRLKTLGVRYISTACARLTELRDLGLVREVGQRRCSVTGQQCIAWTVVPSSEYAGEAIVHRCPECGQIVSRDVPITSG